MTRAQALLQGDGRMGLNKEDLVMDSVVNSWSRAWVGHARVLVVLLTLHGSFTGLAQVVADTAATEPGQFVNEAIVLNSSTWSVLINVKPKNAALELQGSQFILGPGKSAKIAQYTTTEDFVSPVDMMTVTGTVTNPKGKTSTIGVLMMEKRKVSATHRTYYYHVMSGGGFGVSF